jgi:site-specific recombinase XerC
MADLELSDRKGKVIVRQGKGGKRREIPLNQVARQAIRDWLDVRPPPGTWWTAAWGWSASLRSWGMPA